MDGTVQFVYDWHFSLMDFVQCWKSNGFQFVIPLGMRADGSANPYLPGYYRDAV